MALDQSFVGRSYPPTDPYEVGREKIREFAAAVGDTNPVYSDPEAAKSYGYPDVIAPPTFVFAITFKAHAARSSRTRSWDWTTAASCTVTRSSRTPARCAPVTGCRWSPPSSP